jgi:hypothetical protein
MKQVFLIGLICGSILILSSCGSSKATHERRNLMMPKLSEMPKNKKFKEVNYKKRNKRIRKARKR